MIPSQSFRSSFFFNFVSLRTKHLSTILKPQMVEEKKVAFFFPQWEEI